MTVSDNLLCRIMINEVNLVKCDNFSNLALDSYQLITIINCHNWHSDEKLHLHNSDPSAFKSHKTL